MKQKLLTGLISTLCFLLTYHGKAQVPVVDFALSPTIACVGSTIQVTDLSTNSPTTWNYDFGGTPPNSSLQNPVVAFSAPGIYTVSLVASNADGAGTIFTRTIQILAPPQLTVSGTTSLCAGGLITLSVTGADNYSWSSGSATGTETFSPGGTSSFSVTGTNTLAGCSATLPVLITVNPLPALSVSGGTALCIGSSLTQSLSGADTYSWNGTAVAGNTLSINPAVNTTYTLYGTNTLTGCQNSVAITINVNTLPTLTITGNSTVCAGSSVVLTATGADSYAWNDGTGTGAATFTVSSNTGYTVTGTNTLTGCTNTAAATVIAIGLPVLNLSGTNAYCVSGIASQTVTGADTYLWSTGTAANTETFSPSTTTTYSVTGTDTGTGCTNTIAVTITVNALPSLSVTGGTAVCEGSSLTLTLTGAGSFTWNGTAVANNTITISPAVNTTYTLDGINAATGCSNTAAISIVVNSLPTVTIAGSNTVCSASALILTAGGADSYLWNNGTATGTATFTPSSNTDYTVTGTNTLTGCSDIATISVTTVALPSLTLTGTDEYCAGGSASQTVTGADSYLWSTGSTDDDEVFSPVATTVYSVTGTNTITGCAATNTLEITVNSLPVLAVSGNGSVCIGSTVTRSLTGATTYTWNGAAVNGNTVSLNPSVNTTYTLEGTIAATGCTNTTQITITVNALPVITVTGNATVCAGSTVVLTAGGGDNYLWNDNQTTGAATFTPAASTNYSVTGTNTVTGCGNTATHSVTTIAIPVLTLTGTDEYCAGGSATQTVSGADSYLWSTGSATNNEVFNPLTTTIYSVTGTSTLSGCVTTNTLEITVNPLPVLVVSGNGSVCIGSTVTRSLTSATSYTWNGSAVTGNTVSLNPSVNTTYTLEGTIAATGCTNTAAITITVNTLPVISITGNSTVCAGSPIVQTAGGADTYLWNDNQATGAATFNPVANTIYSVTGTNTLTGCSGLATVSVTAVALPVLTLSGTNSYCQGGSATQTVSGANTYSWSTGTAVDTETFNPASSTVYSVSGTSTVTGCTATIPVSITVNLIPTIAVNNGTVCAGSIFTMIPTGADTYTYSTTNNTVIPTANSSYTITGTSAAGCAASNTAIASVTVNVLPVVSINNATICVGTVFTIQPNGASTYTIQGGSTQVTPLTSTTYTLNGTSTEGCISSNTATLSLTVNALPTLTISGNSTICVGGTSTLSVSGATGYVWSNSSVTNTMTGSPVVNTTYTVTGTDANGCVNTAVREVTVNTVPMVTVSNGTICQGSNFVLNPNGAPSYTITGGSATVTPNSTTSYTITGTSAQGCVSQNAVATVSVVNAITLTVSGDLSVCTGLGTTLTASGAATYSWNTGVLAASISPTPAINTTYTVTGYNGPCTTATTVAVTLNALPTYSASSSSPAICVGRTATLSVTGPGTYSWSTQETSSTITVSPSSTTSYTVSGMDANGCVNSAIVTQTVDACTGIASQSDQQLNISLYPNPNNGAFTLETEQEVSVVVFNTIGQVVYSDKMQKGLNQLNLEEQVNGIYYVQLTSGDQSKTIKMIKH